MLKFVIWNFKTNVEPGVGLMLTEGEERWAILMPAGLYLFIPFFRTKSQSVWRKIGQAKNRIQKTDRTNIIATNFVSEQWKIAGQILKNNRKSRMCRRIQLWRIRENRFIFHVEQVDKETENVFFINWKLVIQTQNISQALMSSQSSIFATKIGKENWLKFLFF